MGISPGSIHDLVVQDRIQTIRVQETFVAMALGVLALGAGLLSGGGGAVAVGALGVAGGIGVYDAMQSLKQYEMESAAHGARLLSHDPSLGWVVATVIGASVDLAAAAIIIKAMKPSVLLFNKSGDLIQFENGLKALPQISGELRTRFVAAARQERQLQQAARQSVPTASPKTGSGRGLFGKQSPAPSGPLSPQLRQMYLRELESKWFRTNLNVVVDGSAIYLYQEFSH